MNIEYPECMKKYTTKKFVVNPESPVMNAICYTPYGSVADVVVPLAERAVRGMCPICSEQMRHTTIGLYTCKNQHPLVQMFTDEFRKTSKPTKILPKRRIPEFDTMHYRKDLERAAKENTVSVQSVKDRVADALGEFL